MYCSLCRPDGSTIHTRLDVRATRYSHAAMGGPDAAEIVVTGPAGALLDALSWLAHRVTIHNDGGQAVWWGLVQAVSLRLAGVEYDVDASEIVNRMAVVYTDASGVPTATAWVEDAHSIAQYGRRERRITAEADTDTTALAQATRLVNERSAPLRSVKAAAGPNGAVLRCVGYWRTLDWRYWSRDGGQILRTEPTIVPVGCTAIRNYIYIKGAAGSFRIGRYQLRTI